MKTQKELYKYIKNRQRTYLTFGAAVRGEWDRLTGSGSIYFIGYMIRYIFKGAFFLIKFALFLVYDIAKFFFFTIPQKICWKYVEIKERKKEKMEQLELAKAKKREEIMQKVDEINKRHDALINDVNEANQAKIDSKTKAREELDEKVNEMKNLLKKYGSSEALPVKESEIDKMIHEAVKNPVKTTFKHYEIGDTVVVSKDMKIIKKEDKYYRIREFEDETFIVVGIGNYETWVNPETSVEEHFTLELWSKNYKDSRFYTSFEAVKLKITNNE